MLTIIKTCIFILLKDRGSGYQILVQLSSLQKPSRHLHVKSTFARVTDVCYFRVIHTIVTMWQTLELHSHIANRVYGVELTIEFYAYTIIRSDYKRKENIFLYSNLVFLFITLLIIRVQKCFTYQFKRGILFFINIYISMCY